MKNKKFWVSLIAGVMAGIMILSFLLQLIPVNASAATSSEIQNQINEMEKEQAVLQDKIDELESKREENQTEIEEIVGQKEIVDQQVALLHEQIDNMNNQIAAYAVLIADKQAELDEARALLQELNEKNKERIRAMEEDGQLSYWSVLFKANSFSDLLDRLNMVQEIAASDKRRLEEMSEVAQSVAGAQELLQAEKQNLVNSRAALAFKETELAEKAEESKKLLQDLIAKGEEYLLWMGEKEKELAELEQELADKEVEYDEAKYQEWLATSVPPTTKPPVVNWSGGTGEALVPNTVNGITWLNPCDYDKFSSAFGMRWHPVHGDWRMHNGVDFGVGCTPIYATRSGVVVVATTWMSDSAGYYVMIDHGDGFRSVYMHMCKQPYVKVGDFVGAGQVIGCVGSTGWSTGSHLHFGISYNGTYVNPMAYIKG